MSENHGFFSGEPCTRWLTEDSPDRKMQLLEDFTFTDPRGKVWLTPKDYRIDGASIPRPLWALVGSPYTGAYRRASVVHDKACDDAGANQRDRKAADKMFFHACRAGGCTIEEANILYIGVRFGAWSNLIAPWQIGIKPFAPIGPRTFLASGERRLEADFRMATDLLRIDGITDNPDELEGKAERILRDIGVQ